MHILLPFHDDSALIFARTMGEGLAAAGAKVTYAHVIERMDVGSKISDRQLALYLPGGPDFHILSADLVSEQLLGSFDAIIFNRLLKDVNDALGSSDFKANPSRPCFVAFLPGLEFFPERGIANRSIYDIIYLNHPRQREFVPAEAALSFVGVGHPSFIMRSENRWDPEGKLLFATQAISPLTIAGRVHMANLLYATALANPNRDVVIKLRHNPDENKRHTHKEVFAYEHLFSMLFSRLPSNLRFDDDSMGNALRGAAACLACTSTAAMDALAYGVPAMVYLSYPEARQDPLMLPMAREFADSGLIVGAEDIISFKIPTPSEAWMEENFQPKMPFPEMLQQIQLFHANRLPARAEDETQENGEEIEVMVAE